MNKFRALGSDTTRTERIPVVQKNCVKIRKTITTAGSIICYDKSAVPPLELLERKIQVLSNPTRPRKGMTRGVELGTPDID